MGMPFEIILDCAPGYLDSEVMQAGPCMRTVRGQIFPYLFTGP